VVVQWRKGGEAKKRAQIRRFLWKLKARKRHIDKQRLWRTERGNGTSINGHLAAIMVELEGDLACSFGVARRRDGDARWLY